MRSILALGLGAILLTGLWGCQASGGGAGGNVRTELAPNLDDFSVTRVAVLGLANGTGDREAEEIVNYVTQALYETGKYEFTSIDGFHTDAHRVGMKKEHERMMNSWRKSLTVDVGVVEKLLSETGYDAVLGIEVTNWEEIQIDPNTEGTSDTSVGLHLSMFAPDGTLLWSATELKTEHSPPYNPAFNTRATQSGQSVTTSSGSVPAPPPIKKLAMEVAREVAKTLPEMKGALTRVGS